MSIHINKSRNQYFICYKAMDESTGKYKTITITNSNWGLSKGLKYMKSIEEDVILQDKRKRKLRLSKGTDLTLEDLILLFDKSLDNSHKIQTAYGTRLMLNKYIKGFFQIEKPLDKALSIKTIEAFKSKVVEYGLSVKTKNNILRILRDLLDYGAERDFLNYEAANKYKVLLKSIHNTTKPKEKLCFWTNEQWNAFINTFDDNDKFKMLFIVDYQCALRIGELLALKRNDFDKDKKVLIVDESIDNLGNTTTPKNHSSNATVSLSCELVEKLEWFKKETCGMDDDYMFFADKRTSRTTIRRVMDEHIKIANVPHIKFHGLRHSCASRMINAGCSVLLVSKHLRHASTQQTLDTYSHLFPNETIGLMDKIF